MLFDIRGAMMMDVSQAKLLGSDGVIKEKSEDTKKRFELNEIREQK